MNAKRNDQQRGFSLVEIMIGTVLGMLIVGAVLALLVSSKVAYSDNERRSELTESGRYSLHVMSEQLRLADFWGALQATDITPSLTLAAIASDCTGDAAGYALTRPLWATTAASATVAGCITDAKTNSDVLFVKHVAPVTTAMASLSSDRTYVVANQVTGILFDAAGTAPSVSMGGDVPDGAAWEYTAAAYYVATVNNVPTLMRKRLVGNVWQASEEVAAGIDMLHIEFGEDTTGDGTADRYVTPAVAAMNQVVAARVFILSRTLDPDKGYVDGKTYTLGSTVITPGDRYHRLVFQTTVNLRNRYLHIVGDPAAGGA